RSAAHDSSAACIGRQRRAVGSIGDRSRDDRYCGRVRCDDRSPHRGDLPRQPRRGRGARLRRGHPRLSVDRTGCVPRVDLAPANYCYTTRADVRFDAVRGEVMSITSFSNYKTRVAGPYQRIRLNKATQTTVAGKFSSFWGIAPNAGAAPGTTPLVPTNATAGSLGQKDSTGVMRLASNLASVGSGG